MSIKSDMRELRESLEACFRNPKSRFYDPSAESKPKTNIAALKKRNRRKAHRKEQVLEAVLNWQRRNRRKVNAKMRKYRAKLRAIKNNAQVSIYQLPQAT